MTQSTFAWFNDFFNEVRKTDAWKSMEATVEDSPWHREANVAVHTEMCIDHYVTTVYSKRTPRQQALTLVTLLFHDFGKPEAEEVLEKKDGSGDVYRRYAGHEPKSANEFVSFVCANPDVMKPFFDRGFTWEDVRKVKFMVEHHLPFGLKNPTKRQFLRDTVAGTLGDDEVCFYDQLWSDCNGRVSDDHPTKLQAVLDWTAEFKAMPVKSYKSAPVTAPDMYVLVGVVGVGKTTWTNDLKRMNPNAGIVVVSEDEYRVQYFLANANIQQLHFYGESSPKDQYAYAWKFCFEDSKGYDKYAKEQLNAAVASGRTVVIDRTNQTRKARGPWITAGKMAGYKIHAIEFYMSEAEMHARQKTRDDKDVPWNRAHMIYMNMETPWFPVEVDSFEVVPPAA